MRSEKDPHNTVERLTNAITHLATSTGTAFRRYEDAWHLISKLKKSDFPLAEDQDRFAKIVAASPDTIHADELGDRITEVWELYWRMSSNIQYR